MPILLGGVFKLTNNQPPMVQFKDVKSKLTYQRLEIARFIRKHGLSPFSMNPHFPVNTVQIMRGAVAAEMDGKLRPYVDAVFRHMWEEPKKMDDPRSSAPRSTPPGLDGARTLARIQEQDVKDKLLANTQASVARGTSARRPSSSATRSSSARTGCATSRRRSRPARVGSTEAG